jgi:hypothetical protein
MIGFDNGQRHEIAHFDVLELGEPFLDVLLVELNVLVFLQWQFNVRLFE